MKKILTTVIVSLICIQLFSQSVEREVISFTGSSVQTEEIYISYSVGEPVVGTIGNEENILTQGYQQPGSIAVPAPFSEGGLEVNLFPNPTSNILNVRVKQDDPNRLNVELKDVLGRTIGQSMLIDQSNVQYNIQFDMSQLSNGIYLLTLTNKESSEIQSFKISKVN